MAGWRFTARDVAGRDLPRGRSRPCGVCALLVAKAAARSEDSSPRPPRPPRTDQRLSKFKASLCGRCAGHQTQGLGGLGAP